MNIILISDLWTGMLPVLFEGQNAPKGMPAFFNTFKALKNEQRINAVECYFFQSIERASPTKLPVGYEKFNVNIVAYSSKLHLLFLAIKIVLNLSLRIAFKRKATLLYGHGAVGSLCGIISFLTGRPNIRRLYGTFLNDYDSDTKLRLFFRHPLAFLAFWLPHYRLIVTNDGTHGDRVYKKICGKDSSRLIFRVNGVDKPICFWHYPKQERRRVSYVARVDRWKNQALAIEAFLMSALPKKGYALDIIGPVFDRDYQKELEFLVSKFANGRAVSFVGGLNKKDTADRMSKSTFTLSLYETSNFGNVLIEALNMGVPTLTRNINNSLAFVPSDALRLVGGYSLDELIAALNDIAAEAPIELEKLSTAAKQFSERSFLSWDQLAADDMAILLGLE